MSLDLLRPHAWNLIRPFGMTSLNIERPISCYRILFGCDVSTSRGISQGLGPTEARDLAQICINEGLLPDERLQGYANLGTHPERSLHAWLSRDMQYTYNNGQLLQPYWISVPLYKDVDDRWKTKTERETYA